MMVEGQVPGIWVHILIFEQGIFIFIFCPNICHQFFKTNYYLAFEKGYG